MKREPSIVTGTLRAHAWVDHSTRVVHLLTERAPAGAVSIQSLEHGFRTSNCADLGSPAGTTWMLCALRSLAPEWGESPTWGVNPPTLLRLVR